MVYVELKETKTDDHASSSSSSSSSSFSSSTFSSSSPFLRGRMVNGQRSSSSVFDRALRERQERYDYYREKDAISEAQVTN